MPRCVVRRGVLVCLSDLYHTLARLMAGRQQARRLGQLPAGTAADRTWPRPSCSRARSIRLASMPPPAKEKIAISDAYMYTNGVSPLPPIIPLIKLSPAHAVSCISTSSSSVSLLVLLRTWTMTHAPRAARGEFPPGRRQWPSMTFRGRLLVFANHLAASCVAFAVCVPPFSPLDPLLPLRLLACFPFGFV